MNTFKRSNFKQTLLLLVAFLALQSCQVYHSSASTVDDAILSKKKVKVEFKGNQSFKFNYLKKENKQLVGVAKRKSSTAKKLQDKITTTNLDSKYVEIMMDENTIEKIRLHNKGVSAVVNFAGIGTVAVVGGGFLLLLLLFSL